MILITGASGKTGKTVLEALVNRGEKVRALVHYPEQEPAALKAGAVEAYSGDILTPDTFLRATKNVDTIYHICPNMSPDELKIGESLIQAAQKSGVHKIVYHSVLHPQVELMAHHWQKLRVEERLFISGLEYAILQPAAYMQNIGGYWKRIVQEGVYEIPYAVTARTSMVDLADVAEAAALVITQAAHNGAIYELVGPQALSGEEIAAKISDKINTPVNARALDRGLWEQQVRKAGLADYAVVTLLKMFEYYEKYGFIGNSNVLGWLLGRQPTTFDAFLSKAIPTFSRD